MKKMWFLNLAFLLLWALPVMANVIGSISVPPNRSDGEEITASIYNNDVLGVYAYINTSIVPVLNVVTSKGDLYVYNGSSLTNQSVGADGTVLTANSATATGLQWSAFANSTPLTTKGDTLIYGNSGSTRLPVGADGTVLTADSTTTTGVKWSAPATGIPAGSIMAWSPAYAGTSTVPTGWLMCDGTNSTPNLIGLFIIGAKPPGSTASLPANSFGAYSPDTAGAGTASHTHTLSGSVTSGTAAATVTTDNTGSSVAASNNHVHTFAYSGTSTSASNEPSDYALVYLMKQ
jgi:hypothetical protein